MKYLLQFMLVITMVMIKSATSSAQLYIDGSGNVGMGISEPATALHVKNNGIFTLQRTGSYSAVPVRYGIGGTPAVHYCATSSNSGTNYYIRYSICFSNGYFGIGTTNPQYLLDVNGVVRASNISVSSDKRLKTDIKPVKTDAVKNLQFIDARSYKCTPRYTNSNIAGKQAGNGDTVKMEIQEPEEDNRETFGFIAQDFKEYYPELVREDNDGYLSIDYLGLIPVLVEALKEQSEKVEELENELVNIKYLKLKSAGSDDELTGNNKLYQNSPNPFNESTEIKYYIEEDVSKAYINIYNLNGTQLKSIPLHLKGEGSVEITRNELEPGIYLYALITDNTEADIKRMILTAQ